MNLSFLRQYHNWASNCHSRLKGLPGNYSRNALRFTAGVHSPESVDSISDCVWQGSANFFGRGPHWWFLKTRRAKHTKEFNLPKKYGEWL